MSTPATQIPNAVMQAALFGLCTVARGYIPAAPLPQDHVWMLLLGAKGQGFSLTPARWEEIPADEASKAAARAEAAGAPPDWVVLIIVSECGQCPELHAHVFAGAPLRAAGMEVVIIDDESPTKGAQA